MMPMPRTLDVMSTTSVDETLSRLSDETRVKVLKEFIIELIRGGYGHDNNEYKDEGGPMSTPLISNSIDMSNPTQ